MRYKCHLCQQEHDDLPHIGADKPDHFWDVDESERERRIKLTADTCEIDGKYFFVRGVIEIPVLDYPEKFGFGAWVSHKEENFRKYLEQPDSPEIGPFFGWLRTRISYYKDNTQMLKTMTHYQGGGLRPLINLEKCAHPLAIDQHNGISLHKAWEIVHYYM